MKKLYLLAVITALMTTVTFAQSNSSDVSQNGNDNLTNVKQIGNGNKATTAQTGNSGEIVVTQNGTQNMLDASQDADDDLTTSSVGNKNQITVTQMGGDFNSGTAFQVGNKNKVGLTQNGKRNRANVTQGDKVGGSKFATQSITQKGTNNFSDVAQFGLAGSNANGNTYAVNQNGKNNSVFGTQYQTNQMVTVDQDGEGQDLSFSQDGGSDNIIDVTQSGLLSGPNSINNQAIVNQFGMGNKAVITQTN